MLSKIPTGWRFYKADSSIVNFHTIWLKLIEERGTHWLNLDDSIREEISCYAVQSSSSFNDALLKAIKEALEINKLLEKYNI